MKIIRKKAIIFTLLLCLSVFTSGYKKNAPIILFNSQPITAETMLNNSKEFQTGERIYYIFITEKPFHGDLIRIQLLKKEEKTSIGGYKIISANDYRVQQDQVYYYNDYFVINERGCYVLQVFSLDKLDKPLARDYFFVK